MWEERKKILGWSQSVRKMFFISCLSWVENRAAQHISWYRATAGTATARVRRGRGSDVILRADLDQILYKERVKQHFDQSIGAIYFCSSRESLGTTTITAFQLYKNCPQNNPESWSIKLSHATKKYFLNDIFYQIKHWNLGKMAYFIQT